MWYDHRYDGMTIHLGAQLPCLKPAHFRDLDGQNNVGAAGESCHVHQGVKSFFYHFNGAKAVCNNKLITQ